MVLFSVEDVIFTSTIDATKITIVMLYFLIVMAVRIFMNKTKKPIAHLLVHRKVITLR